MANTLPPETDTADDGARPAESKPVLSCVENSAAIATLPEAQAYYKIKIVRSHTITCRGLRVQIVFSAECTHLYSIEDPDFACIPAAEKVVSAIDKWDIRRFSLDRARLMDQVLPAISDYSHCAGARRHERIIHGPQLHCGRYMRVPLRPGPGEAWTVKTAFPVEPKRHAAHCMEPAVEFPVVIFQGTKRGPRR